MMNRQGKDGSKIQNASGILIAFCANSMNAAVYGVLLLDLSLCFN